jgi:hypothetical protein
MWFDHMNRPFLAVVGALAMMGSPIFAGPVNVPNASFELPATGFVSINIDSWQKAAKPDWYVESGGFMWTQLIGIFKNTATNAVDHIDNCDGNQAIWLFAVPEVSFFQDYDTVDFDDPVPSHAFNATYEVGKSYRFTFGVIGTGGGMLQGATLDCRLYYRDASSNKVVVAVTTVTNTSAVFTNNTHLIDFSVQIPSVQATDSWAGRHIGIQLISTVTTNLQGGYWDLDNFRLVSLEEPSLLNPVSTNGQFQFTLKSEPGLKLEILSTTNVAAPIWASAGIVTNTTGNSVFSDSLNGESRFYRAQRLSP